jgi:periplasmic divalent cation tolerance protein
LSFKASEPIVVFMTASTAAEANEIAEMLVGRRLAACVQILPEIRSVYFWKDEIQRDTEVLILAKTSRGKFAELEREVRAIHSYETPEIIAVGIEAGSETYLRWLTSCLDGS